MFNSSRRRFLAAAATTMGLAGCSRDAPVHDDPAVLVPFYVENRTSVNHHFEITITHKSTDEVVATGEYRLLADHGVRFPTIGKSGETYAVAVRFDGQGPLTRDWTVGSCASWGETEEGRAAGMQVRDEFRGFVQNECDHIVVGYDLTYLTPSESAVDQSK